MWLRGCGDVVVVVVVAVWSLLHGYGGVRGAS